MPFITDTVLSTIDFNPGMTLCDIFAGTGIVSKTFKELGFKVISNDLQYYSYLTAKHFIENSEDLEFRQLGFRPFVYLNSLDGKDGFIFNNYSPSGNNNKEHKRSYFTDYNGRKIDSMRIQIEEWKDKDYISDKEYTFLLASLIESSDKIANVTGIYEAYLKDFKPSALKNIILEPLDIVSGLEGKVYNEDANELIKKVSGDVLYLDPPYNGRRYNTNYHLLETIALYDSPELKGKTGVRVEPEKESLYVRKKTAEDALTDLISNANFNHIFLSYNDEGIIPFDDIEKVMSQFGEYKVFTTDYKRYKSNNSNKQRENVVESLHYLKKE